MNTESNCVRYNPCSSSGEEKQVILRCSHCRCHNFRDPFALLDHARTHHLIFDKPFPCYDCRLFGYVRRRSLGYHQRSDCLGPKWETSSTFLPKSTAMCEEIIRESSKSGTTPNGQLHPVSVTGCDLVVHVGSNGSTTDVSSSKGKAKGEKPRNAKKVASTCRRSLLDWESFINLSKKRRRLSLQTRTSISGDLVLNSNSIRAISPEKSSKLFSSLQSNPSECISHQNMDKSLNKVSSSRSTWNSTSSLITDIWNNNSPNKRFSMKHPKAIAGSTIHLDQSPLLYTEGNLFHATESFNDQSVKPTDALTVDSGSNRDAAESSISPYGRRSTRRSTMQSSTGSDVSKFSPIFGERCLRSSGSPYSPSSRVASLDAITPASDFTSPGRKSLKPPQYPAHSLTDSGTSHLASLQTRSPESVEPFSTPMTICSRKQNLQPTTEEQRTHAHEVVKPDPSSSSSVPRPRVSSRMRSSDGVVSGDVSTPTNRSSVTSKAKFEPDLSGPSVKTVRSESKKPSEIRKSIANGADSIKLETDVHRRECPNCSKRCLSVRHLAIHLRMCTSSPTTRTEDTHDDPDSSRCPSCNCVYSSPRYLRLHLRACKSYLSHNKDSKRGSPNLSKSLPVKSDQMHDAVVSSTCPHCSRQTTSPGKLHQHLRFCKRESSTDHVLQTENHLIAPMSSTSQSMDDRSTGGASTVESSGSFSCPHCHRVFRTHTTLQSHLPKCERPSSPRPSVLRPRLPSMPLTLRRRSESGTPNVNRHFEYSRDPTDRYPRLRLRIRVPTDNSPSDHSASPRSSRSSSITVPSNVSQKPLGRSLPPRSSTGSLAGSTEDVRSLVSDTPTVPAVSERPSSVTSSTRSVSCLLCHGRFPNARLVALHRPTCPARSRSVTRSHTAASARNKLSLSIKLWPCVSCGLKFRSRAVLRSHIAVSCQKSHALQSILSAVRLRCPGCPKNAATFDSTAALLLHLLSLKPGSGHSHTNRLLPGSWPSSVAVPNLGFGCPICGLLLASESRLDKHKRAAHEAWLQAEQQTAVSLKRIVSST